MGNGEGCGGKEKIERLEKIRDVARPRCGASHEEEESMSAFVVAITK